MTKATADSAGEAAQIVYSDGKTIAAPKVKDQVSFGRPLIAEDKQNVGWLAMLPNCCTSYPIPLLLVIYRDGKILQSLSGPRAIWHWRFLDNGERVVYSTDLVHGGDENSVDYELYEVSSGHHLASWSPREAKKQPDWVGLLLSDNTNDLYP